MPSSYDESRRHLLILLAALALTAAVFGIWPQADLWITGLFFDGHGFPIGSSAISERLRYLVWDISIAMFTLALVLSILGLVRRRLRGIPPRLWHFILAVYLLGPILLVNRGLKQHWGRARPDTTTDFGGDWAFTPFWKPGDQCPGNCSFTSGEAASAAALAVALFALGPHLTAGWPRPARVIYLVVALALPAAALFQRVAAGRHFASDVIFGALFVLLIAAVLRPLFLPRDRG